MTTRIDVSALEGRALYVTLTCRLDSYVIAEVDPPTPRQVLGLLARILELETMLFDVTDPRRQSPAPTPAEVKALLEKGAVIP